MASPKFIMHSLFYHALTSSVLLHIAQKEWYKILKLVVVFFFFLRTRLDGEMLQGCWCFPRMLDFTLQEMVNLVELFYQMMGNVTWKIICTQ